MMQEEYKKLIDIIKEKLAAGEIIEEIRKLEEILKDITEKKHETKEELHKKLISKEYELIKQLYESIHKYNIRVSSERGIYSEEALKYVKLPREEKYPSHYYVGLVMKEIPKFKGVNGKVYGPYKPGDIILINEEDYKLLKERHFIKEVSIDK